MGHFPGTEERFTKSAFLGREADPQGYRLQAEDGRGDGRDNLLRNSRRSDRPGSALSRRQLAMNYSNIIFTLTTLIQV